MKLKCVENPTGSQSSVSLFLLEPKTCEYILGVESPMICEILKFADENYGLINGKTPLNLEELTPLSQRQKANEILEKMRANEDE